MRSLTTRVALSAAVVLAVFIALSALALERAFRESARAVRQDRLLAQTYLLMKAAEVDEGGKLTLDSGALEPRLELPASGLYAAILDGDGKVVWRSASHLTLHAAIHEALPAGTDTFDEHHAGQQRYLRQRYSIRWKVENTSFPFTFSVAEDLQPFEAQLSTYRRSLWGWLGAMSLLLIAAQWALLRWGLQPLRQVAQEIKRLQDRGDGRVEGHYPTELTLLTENLNTLLARERAQQKRYRDALADLAHSLKTPLALIRGASKQPAAELQHTLDEQVSRMDKIVSYHLQRAATAGRATLVAPVPLAPNVERMAQALCKVHAGKGVKIETDIDARLRFRGDEGDLTEILGNLLDNACKWCVARVSVSASIQNDALVLRIADDGPGIPAHEAARITERGVRLDQNTPGQGIGLAVTRDIVDAYEGRFLVTRSEWGGAQIEISLPGFLQR